MDAYNDAACIDLDGDVAAVAASSLLKYFPSEDSRTVLLTLFKSVNVTRLGSNEVVITIGGKEATTALASVGSTEFFIQLLTYGLSLSTNDYEALAKCVAICTEWIAALIVERYSILPAPIVARHEFYLDLLLKMLVEIFRLRDSSKQPLLCHLVLRRIEETARENIGSIRRDVWYQVLVFALRTSSIVFQSVGSGLPEFSQRAASVLVHLWLAACVSCFPAPPLWKTLAMLLPKWRHSQPVVDQWGIAVVWLSSLLVSTCFPDRNLQEFAVHTANLQQSQHWAYLAPMFQSKPAVLSQTWYRLLHAAGKSADLCRPSAFLLSTTPPTATPASLPSQEQLVAFIKALPAIFHSSIYTLACVSDLLLGIQCSTILASQLNLLCPSSSNFEGLEEPLGSGGLSTGSLQNAAAAQTGQASQNVGQGSVSHQRKSSRKALSQKVVGRPVSMAGIMGSLTHSSSSTVATSSVAPLASAPGAGGPSSALSSSTSSMPNSLSTQSVAALAGSDQKQGMSGPTVTSIAGLVQSASSMTVSSSGSSSSNLTVQTVPQILVAVSHPKNIRPAVSTLLHLVGQWLVDAIFTVLSQQESFFGPQDQQSRPRSGSTLELEAAIQNAVQTVAMTSEPSVQALRLFSTGTAEALGCLCRLVGSYRRWGPFSEVATHKLFPRFQQILGLSLTSGHPHLIGSILLNGACSWLFHGQLPGITFLVPDAVQACRIALKTNLTSEQKIVHATLAITCALGSLPGSAFSVVVENLFDFLVASLYPEPVAGSESQAQTPVQATYSLETLQLQLASILVLLDSANLNPNSHAENNGKTPIALLASALPAICRLLIAPSPKTGGSGHRDSSPQGRQLCALELLASLAPLLARAAMANSAAASSGQQLAFMVMLSLCQMIETECSRPPTEHSRDLHSVIVAAYSCLAIWVANCGSGFGSTNAPGSTSQQPSSSATPLVACRDFYARVMRVIELGLTGTMSSVDAFSSGTDIAKSASTGSNNQPVTPTTPVTILPVSRRVQLSAETLLHVVLSSPPLPGICRPFATSCCVDEPLLRQYLNNPPSSSKVIEERSYSLGDSVIATFMPTQPDPDLPPCHLNNGVLMLVRNPHGRYCWLLSTQPITAANGHHNPSPNPNPAPASPEAAVSISGNFHTSPAQTTAGGAIGRRFQPPGTDFVGTVQADWNLPRSLTGSWTDARPETMKNLLARDAQRTQAKLATIPRGRPAEPPKPPSKEEPSQNSLFLDRLLLNHLAYTKPTAGQRGRFAMLDLESHPVSSLSSVIDVLPDRLSATLWCFYDPPETDYTYISSPQDPSTVSPLFWELLEAIAWPRPIATGSQAKPPYEGTSTTGILYWADSAVELTVLSPNVDNFTKDSKFHHHHPTAVICFLEDPDTDREVVLKRLQRTLEKLYQASGGAPLMNPFLLLISLTGTGALRLTLGSFAVAPASRAHLSTSLFFAAAGAAPGGLVVGRKAAASFIRQCLIGQSMRTHLVLSAAAPTAASAEGATPASRRHQRIEAYRRSTAVEMSEPDLFSCLFTGHPPHRPQTGLGEASTSPSDGAGQQNSRFSAGLILASGVN